MTWYDFLYKNAHVDSKETILREDAARIVQGIFAFEGKLMLTGHRLLFIPQRPWFWIPILSFALDDLQISTKGNNKLLISAEGNRASFLLPGGGRPIRIYGLASKEQERWLQAIEAAQASLSP